MNIILKKIKLVNINDCKKIMFKKIVPVFILTLFLTLFFTPTVFADTCHCYCKDNSYKGKIIYVAESEIPEEMCSQKCTPQNGECKDSAPGTTKDTSAKLEDPLGLGDAGIDNLWVRIIQALLAFVAIASLVTFVYAGFIFLISTGNAEKVKKAKDIVVYAILGIFISIASYSILSFIFKILEGEI